MNIIKILLEKSTEQVTTKYLQKTVKTHCYNKLEVPDPIADTQIQINTLRNLLDIYTEMWAKEKGGGRTQ